uniref:Uncharacterized protein n=1 Tax=Meloidogyne enterolobii TaxID=390850 RepID=A0A6V7X3X0_MELEN|nr:unnamed protein product [Meloidogyne enterolobii]
MLRKTLIALYCTQHQLLSAQLLLVFCNANLKNYVSTPFNEIDH